MANRLPTCPNPALEYTDSLAEDPIFQDLTLDAKAVYCLLLARAENGIIDDDLKELIQGEKSNWELRLSITELAAEKLIAQVEGVMLYLPRYWEHVRLVNHGQRY